MILASTIFEILAA